MRFSSSVDVLKALVRPNPGDSGSEVGWSFTCGRLLDVLGAFPLGVTKAILLAELQRQWERDGVAALSKWDGVMKNQVSVAEVLRARRLAFSSTLRLLSLNAGPLAGTSTGTLVAKLRTEDDASSPVIEMFLHEKLHFVVQSFGHFWTDRSLRMTGARVMESFGGHVRILPTEFVVPRLDVSQENDALFVDSVFPPSVCALDRDRTHVRAQILRIGRLQRATDGTGQPHQRLLLHDGNSAEPVEFFLYGDQTNICRLLFKGESIIIAFPVIVRPINSRDFHLQWGQRTVIFLVETSTDEDGHASQAMPADICSQPMAAMTQATPGSLLSSPSTEKMDYEAFPKQVRASTLHVNMRNVAIYGRLMVVRPPRAVNGDIDLTMMDSTGFYTVTVVGPLAIAFLRRVRVGHHLFFERLLASAAQPRTGSVHLIARQEDGAAVHVVSTMRGLLTSSYIYSLLRCPLSAVATALLPVDGAEETSDVYAVRAVISRVHAVSAHDRVVVAVHERCRRVLPGGVGAVSCAYCQQPVSAAERLWCYQAVVVLDDGATATQAVLPPLTSWSLVGRPVGPSADSTALAAVSASAVGRELLFLLYHVPGPEYGLSHIEVGAFAEPNASEEIAMLMSRLKSP